MASVLADAETIRKNNTRSLDTKTHSKQEAGAQQYIITIHILMEVNIKWTWNTVEGTTRWLMAVGEMAEKSSEDILCFTRR